MKCWVGKRSLSSCRVPHRSRPPVGALLLLASAIPCLAAQQAQDFQMSIVLQQRVGSIVRNVSSQHVFTAGDRVCFRVRSSSSGFLYVSNRGSSGQYSDLFPGKNGSAGENRIEGGQEYRIPAAKRAWFRLDQPPGYETVYFTFTNTPLTGRSDGALPPVVPKSRGSRELPTGPTPRCDDSLFRSRGECLDLNAGASTSPSNPAASATHAEDGTAAQSSNGAPVSSASPGDAPVVYEFRIAHR